MLTANLKFINKTSFCFFFFVCNILGMYIKNRITNDSYSRSKYLRASFVKTNVIPVKRREIQFTFFNTYSAQVYIWTPDTYYLSYFFVFLSSVRFILQLLALTHNLFFLQLPISIPTGFNFPRCFNNVSYYFEVIFQNWLSREVFIFLDNVGFVAGIKKNCEHLRQDSKAPLLDEEGGKICW
jgi:hypothetical protein